MEKFKLQNWEGDYIDDNNPLWPPFKAEWEAQLPGKRIAKPEEIAKAIISLLDNENSYLNGAVVSVDDGGTDQ
jgi:NAD(P)-dependent dehydrogenase (short-subunit alcohol dehydrogenase family)